jgi:hypothetical protein
MSSASHKRKSNRSPDAAVAASAAAPASSDAAAAAAPAEAEAERASKRQRTQQQEQQWEQEEQNQAAEEAEQESDVAAAAERQPMTDQQRYMMQAYNVVQGPQRLAGQRTGKPSPAAATVTAEPPPLTAEQLSFHNAGLERWLGVRQGWTLRDASGKALKQRNNNNNATTATAAAATSPSAVSDSKTQQLDSGRASSGCSSDGHSSGDEFVAGDSSDDDSSGSDINKHVPRILVARRDYTPFNPRVKLSQMVAILNVCWEEEEDDF